MVTFKYFDDPMKFSYLTEGEVACSICGSVEVCFDGGGFYGDRKIEAICPNCLKEGKLIDLEISTNEVTVPDLAEQLGSKELAQELTVIIEHCTPPLPTWQDKEWPFKDGDFCKFIKIASQSDFSNPEELFDAIDESLRFDHSATAFWEMLPEAEITCIEDGNYDTSFYLFMAGRNKIVTWDCN
ncbi:MAG: hypothetical protein A2075_02125 [Geobacteraceae bacterium GWC2_58_44]|nr:MAG: hypothetical protein A2075_02125 [Geobacteraceae bacterium GWC2_58_44]HBG08194.1 hypothetical protein [Geobacter sp.]